MRTFTILSVCVALLASMGRARAQSINVDFDVSTPPTSPGAGAPASTFAAAGSPGTWNAASLDATAFPLLDTSGSATSATFTISSGGLALAVDNAFTTGDDELLLDDLLDPVAPGQITIANLEAGVYTVLTYAWAPDSAVYKSGVSVNGGPVTSVGGTFDGTYEQGVTHARDVVAVPAGGSITIALTVVAFFASFNGLQIVKQPSGSPLAICGTDPSFGLICPCNLSGAAGHGCANSADPAGALLASTGIASIAGDTLVLSGSGMPSTSTCLYFQGRTQVPPSAFGDGLNCLGGPMTRLQVRTNAGGASTYPDGAEPSISARGGATAGAELGYQILYRDAPSFCTSATFNMTNGLFVVWAP